MAKSQTLSKKKKKLAKKKAKAKKGKKKQKGKASQLSKQEERALKKKRDRELKDFKQYLFKCLGIGIFLGTFAGLLSGDPKLIVVPIAGAIALGLSYRYPRKALWFFIVYMPFSGTVTYAIGNSPVLQLAKDGFYFPALWNLISYCRREKMPLAVNQPVWTAFLLIGGYCCLTLLFVNGARQFDPKVAGHPILMGVLGFKVFLGYAPLMLCSYYLIRDKAMLVFFSRLMSIVVITCCSLAFIQYLLLLTGVCPPTQGVGDDLFKASVDTRCFVGGALLYTPSQGVIRLPGTFVAPWQWGWFMISGAFLGFATAFNDPKPQWRLVGLAAMGINFIMAVLSGQRIALALVPVVTGLLMILTGQVANLKKFLPIAVILGLALTIGVAQNPELVAERFESFQSRWKASPPYAFISHQIEWALHEQRGLLGNGLGRATNSARVFGRTQLVETYYPKVMYEVGTSGALLFLGFVSVITLQCFKSYRSTRDPALRGHGAAYWVFVLVNSYNTYYYPLDVDPVAVYYWFLAGIILKIPAMDREERDKAKRAALLEEGQEAPIDPLVPTRRKKKAATW